MKIMLLNAVPYGSTGKIMFSISKILLCQSDESICAHGFSWHRRMHNEDYMIGNIFTKTFHMCMSKLFGNHGCYSRLATKQLIKKIEDFMPDIIHLHNIHGWYVHIPILFKYLKESQIPVVWTLHDCWAFTGGCAHFTFCNCDKWLIGCGNCNNLKEYPISSKLDKTQKMWNMKKSYFCSLDNLTIVAPSQWLAELVRHSYLRKYSIQVIHNGIDLEIFKPQKSEFRKKYGISKRDYIILGVSLGWSERKGIDVFEKLSEKLPDKYKIVLVGTDDKIDSRLSKSIISIHRTQNQQELAEIYSAANVFVNPTREENYPTVNMESLACGTPVVTFKTGGSPEMLDEMCGSVVECNDIDALEKEIIRICEEKLYTTEACLKKSKEFDQNERFKEYMNLYESIIVARNKAN